MATGKSHDLIPVLESEMRVRGLNRHSLSKELGVSYPTVYRWFSGEDRPKMASCRKIARFLGISVVEVMAMAGHMPEIVKVPKERLPEFREYVEEKYPGLLEEEDITLFEQFIDRRRIRRNGGSN